MNHLIPLESRLCLSAAIASVTVAPDGTLSITGTPKRDSITVDWGATDASLVKVTTVQGKTTNTYTFPSNTITDITVDAGNGNDTIDVSAMTFSATLIGGNGNDTIMGSGAGGSIDGGKGNDTIQTFGGVNTINAGPGNDTLHIAQGDIYSGSRGKDRVTD